VDEVVVDDKTATIRNKLWGFNGDNAENKNGQLGSSAHF
jgi:hypothetical protein